MTYRLILFFTLALGMRAFASCESLLLTEVFRAEIAQIDRVLLEQMRRVDDAFAVGSKVSDSVRNERLREATVIYETLLEVRQRLALRALAIPEWMVHRSTYTSGIDSLQGWIRALSYDSHLLIGTDLTFDRATSFRLRFMSEMLSMGVDELIVVALRMELAAVSKQPNFPEAVSALVSASKPPVSEPVFAREDLYQVNSDQRVTAKIPSGIIRRLTRQTSAQDLNSEAQPSEVAIERVTEISLYHFFAECGFSYLPPPPGIPVLSTPIRLFSRLRKNGFLIR